MIPDWPRYDDGSPVKLNSTFTNYNGNASSVWTIVLMGTRYGLFWQLCSRGSSFGRDMKVFGYGPRRNIFPSSHAKHFDSEIAPNWPVFENGEPVLIGSNVYVDGECVPIKAIRWNAFGNSKYTIAIENRERGLFISRCGVTSDAKSSAFPMKVSRK